MVVASGTVSLLPGGGIGVVVGGRDPVRGVTEALVLPGLVEGIVSWAAELEEGGGCLVSHCEGGTAQSLGLRERAVVGTGVLTVVLGL